MTTTMMMIRAAFVLLAIAAAWSAPRAQMTSPLPECVTATQPPAPRALPTPAKPIGLPEQFGGSCTTVLEVNRIGGAAAFWCKQRAVKPPLLYLYAVEWNAVTPALLADFSHLGTPGDNRQRIADMQAKYQTRHVLDMCDVWGPARERINAARP